MDLQKLINLTLFVKLKKAINKQKKQTLDALDALDGVDVKFKKINTEIDEIKNNINNNQDISAFNNEINDKVNSIKQNIDEKISQIKLDNESLLGQYNKINNDLYIELKNKLQSIKIPKDGKSGKNGVSIEDAYLKEDELIIKLTNDNEINVGKVIFPGPKGDQGESIEPKEPISIQSVELVNCNLIISLTNGEIFELGNVCGEDGKPPEHEWDGTRIRFRNPDGSWGMWVDLRGLKGEKAVSAAGVGQPIITRLSTSFDNKQIVSDTRSINFKGDVNVVKTSKNSIDVDINRLDLSWFTISTNTDLEVNSGYVVDSSSKINITLPVESNVGDKIKIMGLGVGGFKILQNANQIIIFGNLSTTVGQSGELETVNLNNSLSLVCVKENEIFMVESSIGNFNLK